MKFLLVCLAVLLCQVLTIEAQFFLQGWSPWAGGSCTSCSQLVRTEFRVCWSSPPICPGRSVRTRPCLQTLLCGWGEWDSWSSCSGTCGSATRSRSRSCQSLLGCRGSGDQTETCNTNPCPVCYCKSDAARICRNSDEPLCSRVTNRQCLQNVYASFCPLRCNTCSQAVRRICPCGTWAAWTAAPCSTSCGGGTRIRTRQCIPPTSPCFGSDTNQQSCNLGRCLRNRESWRPWGRWSQCSKTCGNGISVRSRRCSLFRFCFGVYTQERACNNQPCFGTVLNRWGPCSKTCGWGTQTRKACAQCPTEYQSCKTVDCTGTCNPPSIRRYGLQSHDCCTNTLTPGSCGISAASNAQSVVNRFPWIGYLWAGKDFCATVLIKNSFSLVAADCVWGKQVNELFVVFGVNANDVYNSPNEQNIFVQRFHIHPSYTPSNNQNFNVAILQFRNSVSLTSFVRPVCLPQGENVQSDLQCIALEWQRRSGSTGTYTTRDLRESFLRILPKGACNLNADPLRQSSLCAGPNNAQAGNCEKLSGTPLVCQRCSSCAWIVAGISHQNSCSNPTASQRFTQVSFYQDWIDGIVPPSNSQTFFPSCP